MDKKSLCGLTSDEIFDLIEPYGYSRAHALFISNSIYKKKIVDFSQIAKIPRRLKEKLAIVACSGIYVPVSSEVSTDNSVKFLFRSETGKEFETYSKKLIKNV